MRQLLFPVIMVAVIMTGTAATAPAQELSQEEYQAKLQELQENIRQLQDELESVRGDRQELLESLEENETEIGDLLEKIDEIESELQEEEQALRELDKQRAELRGRQQQLKKRVAQQIRTAYLLGEQSGLKLLLNQDGPQRLARLSKYHDYVLAAHGERIATYLSNLESLQAVENERRRNERRLREQRQALADRRGRLEERRGEREQLLARLDTRIRNKDEALQAMRDDRRHIEGLMDEITDTMGSAATAGSGLGQLQGDLPWPAEGPIARDFGSDRVAGRMTWEGVLIAAEAGSPVRAIHDGRVIFADYLRGHGRLIIVDHGEGYVSLYAHNESLRKRVGSSVEAGEVIATVGDSGGQRQAGLYFEIRQEGEPTNPARWCS